MILDTLTLSHFRSYSKKKFEFSPGVTLIIGKNTAGKTNILEAISLMAFGKSFRASQDREVIRWGSELAKIDTQIGSVAEGVGLQLMITSGEVQGVHAPLKKYLVNGIARRQIDFIGNLRVVLFWPEHLELITDSPSVRRRYLDSVLLQTDREYRRSLQSYERGVRQRNKLLDVIGEGRASRSQLLFWNQLLIKTGNYITEKRIEFINYINNIQFSISNFQITYDKSVISESRLEQYASEEIAAGSTLVGPHRDDFTVLKAKRELSKYGSRGEQRLGVLWMKLAELSYIQEKTGERPMLLLDDIFSELDEAHRNLVLDIIGKQQTIVTSAEEDILKALTRTDMTIIQL